MTDRIRLITFVCAVRNVRANSEIADMITWTEFEAVEIHCGTVIAARHSEGLRKPAIWLTIDFGTLGIRKSSAQITDRYSPEDLIGRQVVAVTNFPPKQIGAFMSECLVLGAVHGLSGEVTLLSPDNSVPNGSRIA